MRGLEYGRVECMGRRNENTSVVATLLKWLKGQGVGLDRWLEYVEYSIFHFILYISYFVSRKVSVADLKFTCRLA